MISFLLAFTIIKIKKNEIKDTENNEEILEIPKVSIYEEDTKEKLETLHLELDKAGLTPEMIIEVKKINEELREKENYWKEKEKQIKEIIEERKEFITTQTMYPREYAITITELEIALEKVIDYKKTNPYKKDYKIQELIDREKKLVKDFLKTKEKVESSLELLSNYEKKLSNQKEEIEYFSDKQQMYLFLMNGNTKKTKELLLKLTKKAQK